MQTATVSQLKRSLSAYLRQVKTGEEVVITERGRPNARLLPPASATSLLEHVRNLEAQGLLKRGQKPCPRDERGQTVRSMVLLRLAASPERWRGVNRYTRSAILDARATSPAQSASRTSSSLQASSSRR